MSYDPQVSRRSIEVEKWEELRFAIRANDMRFAARHEDKITFAHRDLFSFLNCERSRATAQIVEDSVRQRGQSQAPGIAQFIVEKQSSAQVNASQNVRKNVQASTS